MQVEKIIDKIDWQKQALLPVIVQEETTNEVLMMAYMDKEALSLSLQTKIAHYYSRSKQRIWKKGESSGHTQEIKEFYLDCDNDTLLIKVKQNGVACHTGRKSCFFTNLQTGEVASEVEVDLTSSYGIIDTLYHVIQERKGHFASAVNGIDYTEWNPQNDSLISSAFSSEEIEGKEENRKALREELSLKTGKLDLLILEYIPANFKRLALGEIFGL